MSTLASAVSWNLASDLNPRILMSPLSKAQHSRNQWKHKARRRADDNRYLRKQLTRVTQERARAQQALKDTQARLRQVEAQKPVQGKVDGVFLALQLFLVARLGFRAVSRVLSLLAELLGIPKAPCPQTIINWVTRLSQVRMASLSEPLSSGLIWIIDISIALGQCKILAVLAPQRASPSTPSHCSRPASVCAPARGVGERLMTAKPSPTAQTAHRGRGPTHGLPQGWRPRFTKSHQGIG